MLYDGSDSSVYFLGVPAQIWAYSEVPQATRHFPTIVTPLRKVQQLPNSAGLAHRWKGWNSTCLSRGMFFSLHALARHGAIQLQVLQISPPPKNHCDAPEQSSITIMESCFCTDNVTPSIVSPLPTRLTIHPESRGIYLIGTTLPLYPIQASI